MRESDILHEAGKYWVLKDKHQGRVTFTVMKNGITHSESVDDVTYPDLSIAIARCDYLHKRSVK
jgi:hypothetical protein